MIVRKLSMVWFKNQLSSERHVAMVFVVIWADIVSLPAHSSFVALAIVARVASVWNRAALHLHLYIKKKHVLFALLFFLSFSLASTDKVFPLWKSKWVQNVLADVGGCVHVGFCLVHVHRNVMVRAAKAGDALDAHSILVHFVSLLVILVLLVLLRMVGCLDFELFVAEHVWVQVLIQLLDCLLAINVGT